MRWSLYVDRANPTLAEVVQHGSSDAITLADGEVLLTVERIAVTANNVSYARIGEQLGYWRFYPTPDDAADNWGIVPAWGFAVVERSADPAIQPGQRFYGFLPAASHFVARLEEDGASLIDRSEHRAWGAAVYNSFTPADTPSPQDDYRALLQPLLVTSFLIDLYLAGEGNFGASRIVLSSASSKTAMGLAWLLRQRGGAEVIGLSSPRNAAAIADSGCYDRLLPYDDAEALGAGSGKAIYIDFAGDRTLTARIHAILGDDLVSSIFVGGTHGAAPTSDVSIPGVQPQFFFAPDHARNQIAALGEREFGKQFTAAIASFVAANPWLQIDRKDGPDGLLDAWRAALSGQALPTHGTIVTL